MVDGYDMPISEVQTSSKSAYIIFQRRGRASLSNLFLIVLGGLGAAAHLRVQAHESKKPRQKQDMFEALFNPKSFTQVGLVLRYVCSSEGVGDDAVIHPDDLILRSPLATDSTWSARSAHSSVNVGRYNTCPILGDHYACRKTQASH